MEAFRRKLILAAVESGDLGKFEAMLAAVIVDDLESNKPLVVSISEFESTHKGAKSLSSMDIATSWVRAHTEELKLSLYPD